jgi:hypothetical protein
MAAVEVGKPAVMFHNGSIGEICIDRYWYQARAAEWWTMVHDEPMFMLAFTGRPDRLAAAVASMLTGQEVVLPCMAPVQGDWTPLRTRRGKMIRMKASMKLLDYSFNRDFVGWGAEEFKAVTDMPAFSHSMPLGRMGTGAAGIEAGDLNSDGRPEICVYTPTKVMVLKNDGGILAETPMPLSGGARGAAWAEFSGDTNVDLFVAAISGPRLFLGDGQNLVDASSRLPKCDYPSFTAVAKADFDGDGRADLLLADRFRGLRLYRNRSERSVGATNAAAAGQPLFDDVSESVGLGAGGVGGDARGDHLSVVDVDGDRRPDVLFSCGTGLLILNKSGGFTAAPACGLSFETGGIAPSFGDLNSDGKPDLFVPQRDKPPKVFMNTGDGRFRDVSALSVPLQSWSGWAATAAWCELTGSGSPGILVGCLKGPNRYFSVNGGGSLVDRSDETGLDRRILNTRGVAALDINGDRATDVVFANEGQDWLVLLGARKGGAGARP